MLNDISWNAYDDWSYHNSASVIIKRAINLLLSDMSSPAKDEMESSHWSSDFIKVKTEAYTISRLPKPSIGYFQT